MLSELYIQNIAVIMRLSYLSGCYLATRPVGLEPPIFGYMDFVVIELPGSFDGRVKSKVSVKLFWRRKKFKIPISVIKTTAFKKPTLYRDCRRQI